MKLQNVEDIYPLSPMQQGLLFHSLYSPDSGLYVTQTECRITSGLHLEAFKRAWQWVVDRHPVLRTSFVWEGLKEPLQVVRSKVTLRWHEEDWRAVGEPERGRRLEAYLQAAGVRRFELTQAPLLGLALFRFGEDTYHFVWSHHHLLLDGWCTSVVLNELFAHYEAERRGEDLYAERPPPYRDYIAWLKRQDLGRAEAFWRETLAGFVAPTPLAVDRQTTDTPIGGSEFDKEPTRLSEGVTAGLDALARRLRLTLNTVSQGAWALLLSRYSGAHDVVFGATVSGRPPELEGVESMLGLFINTLPVRVRTRPEEGLAPYLLALQEQQVEARQYEYSPLVDVQSWSEVARDTPLFESILVFENFPVDEKVREQVGQTLGIETVRTLIQNHYPLTLRAAPGSMLSLDVLYDRRRFHRTTVRRLLKHVACLLEGMAVWPEARLGDLPLLSAPERCQILHAWNESAGPEAGRASIHELFRQQAERTPAATAAVFEDSRLSFAELEAQANRLARHLRQRGVGPEARVGVCVERSLEMLVGVIGILKAGGAYVPLDPESPPDRLNFMLRDAGVRLLLTQQRLLGAVPTTSAKVLCLDHVRRARASLPVTALRVQVTAGHLAYVIYTSGSTGRPKGVAIQHAQLVHYVRGVTHRLGFGPGESFALVSTLAADLGNTVLFPPLVVGGCLHVISRQKTVDAGALGRYFEQRPIDTLKIVPSHLAALRRATGGIAVRPRRLLILGGEASPPEWVGELVSELPAVTVVNHYGPTEATVGVLTYRAAASALPPGASSFPLGRPLPGASVYVLDAALAPVAVGVVGELCLGGRSLARAYLFRGALTAEKFVPNPHAEPGARLYRTGDLGRCLPDGTVEFMGRLDDQVKLRGFRIEPGEIEALLARHPEVGQAAVVVRQDEAGDRRLVAYVVGPDGQAVAGAGALRKYLGSSLPEYMLPAAFVKLESLPLTPNGKLDREALPAPESSKPRLETGYSAPRTEVERILATIWSEVLQVEEVGVHDNFFELGGDSILSIQVIARAREAGYQLKLNQIFRTPTIAGLAPAAGIPEKNEAQQKKVSGQVPLTPIQAWFFEQEPDEPHHFNQTVLLRLKEPGNVAALESVTDALVRHHDALRLRFEREADTWRQSNAAEQRTPIWTHVDLSNAPAPSAVLEAAAVRAQASLDITTGPLLRVVFFSLSGNEQRLLITIHHLAVDAVSWRVLLEDLQRSYELLRHGRKVELPTKTTSFREWSRRLTSYASSEQMRGEAAYWTADERRAVPRLPVDHAAGVGTVASASTLSVSLDTTQTRHLLQDVPGVYRTQVNDVLLTALGQTIATWTGANRVAVDLEGHGREDLFEDVDLSRTVGWFTSLHPVLLDVGVRTGPGELLKAVKEQIRSVPRRGIGYGILHALRTDAVGRLVREQSRAMVRFNYLGQLDPVLTESGLFTAARESTGSNRSPKGRMLYPLDVSGMVVQGCLRLDWRYSKALYQPATIEALARYFKQALVGLIEHCLTPEAGGYTPSDFPLAGLDQSEVDRCVGPARDVEDVYSLSPLQQGLLFHALYAPGSVAYFEQLSGRLTGGFDATVLRRAWRRVVERHAILRTSFAWEQLPEPVQVVRRGTEPDWSEHDWRGLGEEECERRVRAFLDADRERGFDFVTPPVRLALLRLGDASYHLVWSYHHLLLDGWSSSAVVSELFTAYAALGRGEEPAMERPRPYRDYIAWLRDRDLGEAEAFWRRELAGLSGPTRVGLGLSELTLKGEPETYGNEGPRFSRETSEAVEALARRCQLTVNTVLQGAWALLLSRYSGAEDVVFGATVSGRPAELPGVESMLGLFINTLPVRVRVRPEQLAEEYLRTLQHQQVEARQYEYSPLVEVQGWSEVPRGTPLFESLFVFENYPVDRSMREQESSDLHIDAVRKHDWTHYVLTLEASAGASLRLRFRYDTRRFESTAIRRLGRHLRQLLEALAAARPSSPLASLPAWTRPERRQVLAEWNDTRIGYPRGRCLHELFAEQVARTPRATAVVDEHGSLSYEELDTRAERLAGALAAQGVGPDRVVAVADERGRRLLALLLGIFKAGGAYLPLDPRHPASRNRRILEQAGACLVVAPRARAESVPSPSGASPVVILEDLERGADIDANPRRRATPRNLAYVIFTSGSTGIPKGAMVEHRGLVNHLFAKVRDLGLDASDTVAQTASQCFDISVWQFFSALVLGGTTRIVEDETAHDPERLLASVEASDVSILEVVPSVLRALLGSGESSPDSVPATPALRWLIVTGEALTADLCRAWLERYPAVALMNAYGPTECSDDVSHAVVARAADASPPSVTIGRPVANTQLYVVNRRLDPVPVGAAGELCAGGDGVGRGYLRDPAKTARVFVPDPFGGVSGSRLYRTGDLSRHREAGDIVFLGRIDHQVKLHGHRIELGEIESVLERHPRVGQAVVVAREDQAAGPRLVAWVVAKTGAAPGAGELREFVGTRLPAYMVPSAFVALDCLPLTANGKVDRRALPAPGDAGGGLDYTAPSTTVQEVLANIWADVLGLERVGATDDFFEIGGHSLVAARLIGRVRDAFGIDVALRRVFERPTLEGLAEYVEAERRSGRGATVPSLRPRRRREEPSVLSYAQQRLWFLDRLEPGRAAYNVAAGLRLYGPLDVALLRHVLDEIVRRHEVLRTRSELLDGEPIQVASNEAVWPLTEVDLRGAGARKQEEVRRHAAEEVHTGFNLERTPPVRGRILCLGEEEHALLLTLHHIVTDGWSMDLLVHELTGLYTAWSRGGSADLPELPIQYGDYARWQRDWLRDEVLEAQVSYWKKQLQGIAPVLELPSDRPRPASQTYRGALELFEVPETTHTALTMLSRSQGVTLYMTLLAAFQVLLGRYAGVRDVAVGSPVAGRLHSDLEKLIGLFINTLVMRTDLTGRPVVEELSRRVREVALEAFAHQDVPFEKLVEELEPERSLAYHPLFQVMFTLQNAASSEPLEVPGLEVRPLAGGTAVAKFDLELLMGEQGGRLGGAFQFSTDLFDRATIRRLAGHFTRLLEAMVTAAWIPVESLPLMAEQEQRQLLVEWNATAATYPDRCLHELFEKQVEATPQAIAVRDRRGASSFAELDHRANRLAAVLTDYGVGPDRVVAIATERGSSMLALLLGTFKAGGAYLPLDPTHPPGRNAAILHQAGVALVVAGRAWVDRVVPAGALGCRVLVLEELESAGRTRPVRCRVSPHHLAYVIFTSGSTGAPKGAMVEHRGLVNHLFAKIHDLALSDEDTVAQTASQCFDISVWQFFSALVLGGTTHILDDKVAHDPGSLLEALAERRISILEVVPSLLRAVLNHETAPPKGASCALRLRWLIATGEALPSELCRQWFEQYPSVPMMNAYGPTECSDDVSHAVITRDPDVDLPCVTIGRPIVNTGLYVADWQLDPLPMGVAGELRVGGDGVGRGYLYDPVKTAKAFVPDPFGNLAGRRLYCTGDLARYLADGNVEFLGRVDHQVKLHGFRIELGEIENALSLHPGVAQAVLAVFEDRTARPRLVAYVVGHEERMPRAGELRDFVAGRLPAYMVPSTFVELERVPLTPNGKVDRTALGRRAMPAPQSDDSTLYVAPSTPLEEVLAGIWAEALELERVSTQDNFFELGGDSFLMMKVVSLAAARQVRIAPRQMFRYQTVAALADGLYGGVEQTEGALVVPFSAPSEALPFFCVHPAGGRVQFFWPLARELGPRHTFYGIRSRPFVAHRSEHWRVEDLAAEYVAEMRSVRPHGPYCLGGYSTGVFLAFEMARQITAAREQVALLALLDAAVYRPPPEDPQGIRHLVQLASYNAEVELDPGALRQIPPENLMNHVLREIESRAALPPDRFDLLSAVASVGYANQLAVDEYMARVTASPDEYPCPVTATVFRAADEPERDPETDRAVEESLKSGGWDARAEADFGWGRYCTKVEMHMVPGDHGAILDDPNVSRIAEVIRQAMERAEEAQLLAVA